jgi:uncharacterized membrane protein YdbT with pleckstrin-like domain
MSDYAGHLEKGERLIWSGRPIKSAFLFHGIATSMFGVVWTSFMVFIFWMINSFGGDFFSIMADVPDIVMWMILLFFVVGIGMMFGPIIMAVLRYRNTLYTITDMRLIVQSGAIGMDTRFIDLDKIQEVYVRIGIADKFFGTGSLFVVSSGFMFMGIHTLRYPGLRGLKEPYMVQEMLQEAIRNRRYAINA